MERSPEWNGAHFENPQPIINDAVGSITTMFHADKNSAPPEPPAHIYVSKERFAVAPASGLRVTWFGHSATLVEIDGHRFLTDPVWSERLGPVAGVGPSRWFPPLIALKDLPPLDAVIISHDHYDHLDYATVRSLAALGNTFVVPLGVGAHLAKWGVAENKIIELDWWETKNFGDLQIVATPARHVSGRFVLDYKATLWAGYALLGTKHRVYFSGDTGLFPALREIGSRLGPFDLSMIEVGQYNRAWPDWHIGPEQAVRAHQLVGAKVMLPIHWGLFELASHGWTEPMERALAEGKKQNAVLIAPRPGESVEPDTPAPVQPWWPQIPWHTGEQDPIVSSQMD